MGDDIEFSQEMLRLNKEDKYYVKNKGMKQADKSHNIRTTTQVDKSHNIRTITQVDKSHNIRTTTQVEKSRNIITTSFSYFPESIMFDFLVRIPPRYIYKNFMPVCKSWKEIFSKRSFVELNFEELKIELLLILAASATKHTKTKLIEIGKEFKPESHDLGINRLGEVRSSRDGFLLIHKLGDNREIQVINPTTKYCLTIPNSPSGCQLKHKACSAALGFDSLKKQYKVVHIVIDYYGFKIFYLSTSGDDEIWKRVSGPWDQDDLCDRPFNQIDFHWKNAVSINGRILHRYVDSNEYFISLDIKEGNISRTNLPTLGLGEVIKRGRFELVELGGFLSFVYSYVDMKMDVWILEDFQGQVWSKKHSIMAESINYINPEKVKPLSKYEILMPDLGKLVAVAGIRNGGVLILKNKNSNIYIYDIKTKVMKKANINMNNIGSIITYKDSLFSINRIS